MIVFLTVSYIAILALLLKLKIVPSNTFTKLSPVAWVILLTVGLFIPMQFWAPAGKAMVYQYTVAIVPNVAGQVTEVPVEANKNIAKDDVLFKIDDTPYKAALDQVTAQLELAENRLEESKTLRKQNAISIYELEQYEAQVKQLQGARDAAAYNLEQTVVRAPSNGFITNLALRPGARVTNLPFAQTMAFVENSERVLAAQVHQSHLRFIEPGHAVEIAFKLFPGKIYSGTVEFVTRAGALGQVLPGGTIKPPQNMAAAPFYVRIKLDDAELMEKMPAGAMGDVAFYTDKGKPTHIIRKVMVRMTTYVNFINPF
ncbi:MAG: efflux RND transporter periplasmic adaptor subunit [Acidobacteriota bacterium]|nr:efflux RND transporter periplasmic adaptor subunit [Acidobacteriota bacterium]